MVLLSLLATLSGIVASAALMPHRRSSNSNESGKLTIHNQCNMTVFIESVADSTGPRYTRRPGSTYRERYRLNPRGGGISLKLSTDPSFTDISQIEYTLTDQDIYYDLSNIDGYPFLAGGVEVRPVLRPVGEPVHTCVDNCCPVACAPGLLLCPQAYNQPHDDHATHACPLSTDLEVRLCP